MRRTASTSRKAAEAHAEKEARLAKQLWWWLVTALLAAALTATLLLWDRWFSSSTEHRVKVYWAHECTCAASWIKSLQAAGFTVTAYEYNTLQFVRNKLQVPENLHGCHVGEYLGYFLEGHVVAEALASLAIQRPKAEGLVTQASLTLETEHLNIVTDQNSAVLLVSGNHMTPWLNPEPGQSARNKPQ